MYKAILLFTILISGILTYAQTTWTVTVGGNQNVEPYFSPQFLTIAEGDIVEWNCVQGTHNINGEQDSFPLNPEYFSYKLSTGQASPWNYTFTFNTPGDYDYQCSMWDHYLTQFGTITVIACPLIGYSYATSSLDVTFTNSSTVTSTATYSWDFGDGSGSSTQQDPSYTYTASGTYNVCLTVVDSCGTDSFCQGVTVIDSAGCPPPTADFSYATNSLDVIFTNSSTVADTATYSWDFGDGSGTSIQQSPTYTYTVSGTYNVCLNVTDSCGNSFSCQSILVDQVTGIDAQKPGITMTKNSPNPFSDKTDISFDLREAGVVSFVVVDIVGKIVYSQSTLCTAGTNNIDFNARRISPGLYIYNLLSGVHSVSGKMTVNK